MTHIELVQHIWQEVYALDSDVASVITEHFHPSYEQCINGVELNRSEYIEHVIAQKQTMNINEIEYKNFIEQGDELFASYYPKGHNFAGSPIEAEVIAYFKFIGNQIARIHGQVRLLSGDFKDVDME